MYQIINDRAIRRLRDGAYIPAVEGNSDYEYYLTWLSEGNTPEPADEVAVVNPVTTAARLQRDLELSRADIMLNRVQDGETGLGTQKAWRAYRMALRNWPDTEDFPEVMPVAPDAK